MLTIANSARLGMGELAFVDLSATVFDFSGCG
jgi:hypothetical protein